MTLLRIMTPAEYSSVNLIGTPRVPNRGVEGNQALVQALGDKLREIADENATTQNANNTEFSAGIAAAAKKTDTYTRAEIDSKDSVVLNSSKSYIDERLLNFFQSTIYDVLYYDPLDGFKKKLQEILANIASQQLPGYSWLFLDVKDYIFQEWDGLDLSWAQFDGGEF